MKKNWAILLLLSLLLLFNVSSATAQTYRFQVVSSDVSLYINSDGTASIDYALVFLNDSNADPIDYVDIGLPTSAYDSSSITASVDGHPVTDIENSPYVHPGIALGLGSNAIQPGEQGEVQFHIGVVEEMVFPSTEDDTYASIKFSPTWFDSSSVQGSTSMTVTIFLPPGMEEDQPKYYTPQGWPGTNEPQSGYDEQDRVFYRWHSTDANSGKQYIFGAGFPASLVPESAISTPIETSSGSGFISSIFSSLSGSFCPCSFFLLWGGIIGLSIYQGTVGAAKRRMKYLPPKISVEGHGIKRGLTAVEAAVLMEQPMDKLLTMILFSIVKKEAATVLTKKPLTLEIHKPLPEDLRAYEIGFLQAFEETDQKKRQSKLQDDVILLIKSVTEKMKGFSHKETVEYYKSIIEKAWQHVQAADTPEVQMKNLDEALDWTMLDRKYEERSRQVFVRPVFVPTWWGRFDPTFHPVTTPVTASIPSAGSVPTALPHLPGSDFAASVVTNVQNFSSDVIGNLQTFTSGVTNKTNPIPVSKSSGKRGGGGGRSCACACACAGCACACAGGGR